MGHKLRIVLESLPPEWHTIQCPIWGHARALGGQWPQTQNFESCKILVGNSSADFEVKQRSLFFLHKRPPPTVGQSKIMEQGDMIQVLKKITPSMARWYKIL